MHVVLVHPEIAPNTGAIIRLCANTGAELHLVEPLGFVLSDSLLKRGGLDYHEHATMQVHPDVDTALAGLPGRRFGFSSRGARRYTDITFAPDDVLVFGAERAGLDEHAMSRIPDDHLLSIPMRPDNRSLNLANAVSIVLYEAWRQHGFDGAAPLGGTTTAERLHLDPFDR
ncbi:MAG: tRNA (cytidine(34)-2'-O)-methyltransferase [Acidimicrobiales bacterium]